MSTWTSSETNAYGPVQETREHEPRAVTYGEDDLDRVGAADGDEVDGIVVVRADDVHVRAVVVCDVHGGPEQVQVGRRLGARE